MKQNQASKILCSLILLACVPGALAETVSIEFDSLPSNQGWEYSGTPLAEDEAYSVGNFTLEQTTVESGSNSFASYQLLDIVDSSRPMSLSFTARVLIHEDLTDGTTGEGFNFHIRDGASVFRLAMTDNAFIVNGQSFDLDTTAFHDYVLDTRPGGEFDLFVDGTLLISGNGSSFSLENGITFGDTTLDENTDAEITALSFTITGSDIDVKKSVDNKFPLVNEPVEFTIDISNIGNQVANDVMIIDRLPAEMSIPVGSAPFASVGSYDPVSGEWFVGDLDAGVTAVLSIPAVVTEPLPPDCIVNLASSQFLDVLDDDNDDARAAIHQAGVERCVDIEIAFGISVNSPGTDSACNLLGRYVGDVEVTNHGPDSARNVAIVISINPVIAANLRFDDTDCTNAPSDRCNVTEIKAGETVTIDVTSDLYQSHNSSFQTIAVTGTTSDSDYDLSNNDPATSGTAGGFSSCVEPDFGLPDCLGHLCSSGSSGGCFIATAAYGHPMDPHLDSLREFRDSYMITNRPGRALVSFYYWHSPPIADFISKRDWLRAIVRGGITPIVFSIEHPIRALILLTGLIAGYFFLQRRRLVTVIGM